jgi:hypothetical protein
MRYLDSPAEYATQTLKEPTQEKAAKIATLVKPVLLSVFQ